MQVLQAGHHKLILLEIDPSTVLALAQEAGFSAKLKESARSIVLDLTVENLGSPLLLFDAADPANLGWFSRCQFYVNGRTGEVMQTPMAVHQQPIYLYVPPGHQKNWAKHCARYNACGQPVYFVQERWVQERYQQHQRDAERDRHEHGRGDRGDRGDHGRGNQREGEGRH